ncbi:hypothetical protein QE385_001133 [Sphingomonas sp. SORGH_AS 950]|uniref:hypothetical protein n=1 Tax=Sphingomonas sp. SORGH_AS_0950 TaxID=3041792 RepID=UPI0027879EF0|nr:hypothetical protein [Sphingomonas sp. SORGH_AS_0950]MDQ1156806.1 hypothetical protein [Sphingomonas sp. SORGH_AS_0950]
MANYLKSRNRVIEVIGREASVSNIGNFDIQRILDRYAIDHKSGWAHRIAQDMADLKLGDLLLSAEHAGIVPNGRCIEFSEDLAAKRTVVGRMKSVSRSDWIAFGAFVTAVVALFK